MKKRIVCILLILALGLGSSGCGVLDFIGELKSPETHSTTRATVNTGSVPTAPPQSEATGETTAEPTAESQESTWRSDTHGLCMVTVTQETGEMVDCFVRAVNKMGEVFDMTDEAMELPEGDYTIFVEADGYWPHREDITVVPGEETVFDFKLIPEADVEPYSVSTFAVVGDKAYFAKEDGLYCIDAGTKEDELGKTYVSPETALVCEVGLIPFTRLAANGITAYVADENGVILEIDLETGEVSELTEPLGPGAEVSGADRYGVFVTPYTDHFMPEDPSVYGKVVRVSLLNGEIDYYMDNFSAGCAGGFNYLTKLSGGVDPCELLVYNSKGELVLDMDTVWAVSSLGDRLVISEAVETERSFRIHTFGEDGLSLIYEVVLGEDDELRYAGVNGGLLTYTYSNSEGFTDSRFVDLYTSEDVTDKYPEMTGYFATIRETGEFKYYCTTEGSYFAGVGYVFPMSYYGDTEVYCSQWFINGCVIEFDNFSGEFSILTPPVA